MKIRYKTSRRKYPRNAPWSTPPEVISRRKAAKGLGYCLVSREVINEESNFGRVTAEVIETWEKGENQ